MRRLKQLGCLVAVLTMVSGCSTGKAVETKNETPSNRFPKAYQAIYSAPNNFAYQTEHFYSDGNGHVRLDISGQGPPVVHVLDMNTNQLTMWSEGVPKAFRRPGMPMDPLMMYVNCLSMPKQGTHPLGARNVNGHICHGWSESGTEVWFDDNYGCPVLSTSGSITSTLSQFTGSAPDPSVFQPPVGYEIEQQHVTRHHGSNNSRIFSDIRMHMH